MSLLSILLFGSLIVNAIHSELVPITAQNHDDVMQKSRLTFVSFTASWCPFSRNLLKSFTEGAVKYKEKYPERKTVWGNVDCVKNEPLCDRFSIKKYPTMKVFFYGYMMLEFRGSRKIESLIEYVEKMENTTSLVHLREKESLTQWQQELDPKKGTLILWFPQNSPPFELILKAIALIHDRLTVVVPVKSNLLEHEDHKLWFSPDGEHVEQFNGTVTNFKEIVEWVRQKSAGMVRELTFENAEEIVEDGKPMLILFKQKDDKESERKFVEAIRRELTEKELSVLNPLIADGELMLSVMKHFGRPVEKLPFLIIDQFVHSYPAPWDDDEIFAEGNIKSFVADLFNNNHHKRLHERVAQLMNMVLTELEDEERKALEEKTTTESIEDIEKRESVFNKLQPAKNRYSFAKQEL